MAKPKVTNADKRRKRIREEQFGDDSWDRVWKGAAERKGYACLPRVLPLVMQLAHDKRVTGSKDCRGAYLELLFQDWGQGLVEIQDEHAHAFRAGYSSSRALRTWRERIHLLEEAGFIEIRPKAVRDIGYVLIRHPHAILTGLRAERRVSNDIWLAYEETCRDFGMEPPPDPLAVGPRGIVPAAAAAASSQTPDDDDIPF